VFAAAVGVTSMDFHHGLATEYAIVLTGVQRTLHDDACNSFETVFATRDRQADGIAVDLYVFDVYLVALLSHLLYPPSERSERRDIL